MKTGCFHSCFVIDVQVLDGEAVLTDSTKMRWHVKAGDQVAYPAFQKWFGGVFLKGVAQTLTVFSYEKEGNDVDFEYVVKDFFSLPPAGQLLQG